MSKAPFMQLYVGDYLADTTDLTTEQHGAYLLLLMTMWRHGAELPDDAKKLARIARVSPKRWRSIWAEIGHFFQVADGKVTSPRLTKEYQKAVSISQKRIASGAKGGAAKALKSKEAALANATDLPKHSQKSEVIKIDDDDKARARDPNFDLINFTAEIVRLMGVDVSKDISGKWSGSMVQHDVSRLLDLPTITPDDVRSEVKRITATGRRIETVRYYEQSLAQLAARRQAAPIALPDLPRDHQPNIAAERSATMDRVADRALNEMLAGGPRN